MLDLIGKAQAASFTIPDISPLAGGFTSPKTALLNAGLLLVWFAGFLAMVYLIYGGVLYITAGGDAEKATKGRTAVINAIIGVIIILLAVVIISWVKKLAGGSTF